MLIGLSFAKTPCHRGMNDLETILVWPDPIRFWPRPSTSDIFWVGLLVLSVLARISFSKTLPFVSNFWRCAPKDLEID